MGFSDSERCRVVSPRFRCYLIDPPVSHIFRTFHVPVLIVFLVVRRDIGLMTSAEWELSARSTIILQDEGPLIPEAEFTWFKLFILVRVVLARLLFKGWRYWPHHSLPGLGTGSNPSRAIGGVN
ncbi:unnamed protein product [Schistosoma curassoni]|nr:unnamed protein product [Schistosoma curassoni]